jgi:hypothetical protein
MAARGAGAAWKLPTVGFLGASAPAAWGHWTPAFVQRLRELGWIEGLTLAIEYRWAEGRSERYTEIAAEFVRLKVDVIVTVASAVVAAKQVTSVIPIVFAVAVDPLATDLVASLARPGGNVTGLSIQSTELVGKRFELLPEVLPGLRRLAIMANVGYPAAVLEMGEAQRPASLVSTSTCSKSGVPRISHIGIVLWCMTAAICLYAGALAVTQRRTAGDASFLIAAGLLTGLLAFDDLFLFHEWIGPRLLSLNEVAILACYGILAAAYIVLFRRQIMRHGLLLFAASVLFGATSVLGDLSPIVIGYEDMTIGVIEDGAKFIAIALWAAFHISLPGPRTPRAATRVTRRENRASAPALRWRRARTLATAARLRAGLRTGG